MPIFSHLASDQPIRRVVGRCIISVAGGTESRAQGQGQGARRSRPWPRPSLANRLRIFYSNQGKKYTANALRERKRAARGAEHPPVVFYGGAVAVPEHPARAVAAFCSFLCYEDATLLVNARALPRLLGILYGRVVVI